MFLTRSNHLSLFSLVQYFFLFIKAVLSSYKEYQQPFPHQTDHLKQGETGSLFDNFAFTASTDESKLRLALLVDDKIDRNKDGLVQLDELVKWLRVCQDKYEQEDVDRHWLSLGKQMDDADGALSWDDYSKKEHDHILNLGKQTDNPEQIFRIKKSHENAIQKDLRRWDSADIDQNGKLSKTEFKSFLYPEHFQHMHKLVVEERFDNMDLNKDGLVSSDEFLANLGPEEAQYDSIKKEDWLRNERLKFTNQLDRNHDNYLDRVELSTWISQKELDDHGVAEAKHLMQSADINKDHRLTKEEILGAYNEFVNSHATDFGEALRSPSDIKHDEL